MEIKLGNAEPQDLFDKFETSFLKTINQQQIQKFSMNVTPYEEMSLAN